MNRLNPCAYALCLAAFVLSSCGGSGPPGIPNGTAQSTQARSKSSSTISRFAYVSDLTGAIYAYAVDSATGALTPLSGSPFPAGNDPWGIAGTEHRLVYVANGVGTNQHDSRPNQIGAYKVDTSDGTLTPVAGSPFDAPGKGAADMAIAAIGPRRYAYVVNIYSGDLSAFQIDTASGALTALSGSPFETGAQPESLTIDPRGKFVFVPNTLSDNVSAFKINRATGTLTQVSGSPFTAGTTPAGAAVDSTGSFLYISNGNSNNISAYVIHQSTGVLTPVAGSPFRSDTPSRIAADPNAGFVYATNNGSNTVSAYAIDPVSGALKPVKGSPFAAGTGPSAITIDAAGTFAYVGITNGIFAYKINQSSGALTPVAGSPFPAGMIPMGIIIRR